ncbi:MAG: glutamine-hydrolyzing GMP synthase [Bacteroidota bacterium]
MSAQIIILDFGSQYTQLIARRVRELNVFCEIHPFSNIPDLTGVKGLILSGSPCSVRDEGSPNIDLKGIRGNIPVLGICYGAQLLAAQNGGKVAPGAHREYGRANLSEGDMQSPLLSGLPQNAQVWMSHGDTITELPAGAEIIASTDSVKVAAFRFADEHTYGIQFHPEVTHTPEGADLLHNFVISISGCEQNWTPEGFVDATVKQFRQMIGRDKIVLGLSGGVDSAVAAMLLHKAIGHQQTCIFVDNGLLRKNEFEQVQESLMHLGLNIKAVNARQQFYDALAGLTDPEEKRKAIGKTFIEVFEAESNAIEGVKWLGQGTIYPDVIESVSVKGPSVTIKSHHNVGGLPDRMKLKVAEPLRTLFKDEVRKVGRTMGLPAHILDRHPFPGPGLAIRIPGEVTAEKADLLREADAVFIDLLRRRGLYNETWQAGVILLPVKSVGVMGDERSYGFVAALRAVTSIDGMTADWARLPYDFLAEASNEIINKVRGINRVVYDISSKPPATIEWE